MSPTWKRILTNNKTKKKSRRHFV